jgi:hypothetical protein
MEVKITPSAFLSFGQCAIKDPEELQDAFFSPAMTSRRVLDSERM